MLLLLRVIVVCVCVALNGRVRGFNVVVHTVSALLYGNVARGSGYVVVVHTVLVLDGHVA